MAAWRHEGMARWVMPLLPLMPLLAGACAGQRLDALRERELAEVRTAFEENLAAIRRRDVEGYLSGYLMSADFLFLGPDGVERGFAPFAEAWRANPQFPDSLASGAPQLSWLAPGVVHVAYPYVARQGTVAGSGWSERVFVKTPDGWKIAVTGVIPGGN
jgi:ketosteroid isomerase-like protein